MKKHTPKCWTMGLNGEICLGFADGKYLPNYIGKNSYPQYFDENGKPVLDLLPMDSKKDSE